MGQSSQRLITIKEAARALGVSMDTIRRWDKSGKITTVRDSNNKRMIPEDEVSRLASTVTSHGNSGQRASARNRIPCLVTSVEYDGFLARVEMQSIEPARLVAIITSEAARQLELAEGSTATAIVKATSMMVEQALDAT